MLKPIGVKTGCLSEVSVFSHVEREGHCVQTLCIFLKQERGELCNFDVLLMSVAG